MKKKIVDNNEYAIPVEGSLGLLALGDIGIRAWRKVRDEEKKNINQQGKTTS